MFQKFSSTFARLCVFILRSTSLISWGTLFSMNKQYGIYAAVGALLVLIIGTIWWARSNPPSPIPEQTATSRDTGLSTTTTTTAAAGDTASPAASQPTTGSQAKPAPLSATGYRFSLVPGETVASWNFAGSYKDGGTLEASRYTEIVRLLKMLNSGTFTNYELYVSIANQYDLLGDGKQEFTYLNYALAIDSTKTGLAWHNMAKLLERLGAYKSARVAYDKLVQAQSTTQYLRARLEFLQAHMPQDSAAIAQAQAALSASTW